MFLRHPARLLFLYRPLKTRSNSKRLAHNVLTENQESYITLLRLSDFNTCFFFDAKTHPWRSVKRRMVHTFVVRCSVTNHPDLRGRSSHSSQSVPFPASVPSLCSTAHLGTPRLAPAPVCSKNSGSRLFFCSLQPFIKCNLGLFLHIVHCATLQFVFFCLI